MDDVFEPVCVREIHSPGALFVCVLDRRVLGIVKDVAEEYTELVVSLRCLEPRLGRRHGAFPASPHVVDDVLRQSPAAHNKQ